MDAGFGEALLEDRSSIDRAGASAAGSLLLKMLYSIRSERQLMEQLDYNLSVSLVCGIGDGRPSMGRDGIHQEPGAFD